MNRMFCILFASMVSTSALAQDIRAQNCEMWIDKMGAELTAYHGAFGAIYNVRPFVKLNLDKLRPHGSVKRVVWFGIERQVDNDGRIVSETPFRAVELTPFMGSADYFFLNLGDLENHWWDSSNTQHALAHEGAFFVEMSNGTRLWINSAVNSSQNFMFDKLTLDTLRDHGQTFTSSGYIYGPVRVDSVEKLKKTAEYNSYWNPYSCR